MDPLVIGPAYSVYVRSVRIALEEKGVPYRLEQFDVFDDADIPSDYLDRHPFKRVPAFEHDGFALYESGAVLRYIDEAFAGPPLQPSDLRQRARMNQILAVIDNYLYWPLVRTIFVQREREAEADEVEIADALPAAKRCLAALERLIDAAPFLTGSALTLADCHAIPMFTYFSRTPEARTLMPEQPRLSAWWAGIQGRPSIAATRFPDETA